jgi:predicted PurR-regulated permease PerM
MLAKSQDIKTFWLWAVVLGLLITVGLHVKDIIIDVLLAGVLASALYPPVSFLQHKKVPRKLAILLCYAVLLLAMAGASALMANVLLSQGKALIEHLPRYVTGVQNLVNTLPSLDGQHSWVEMAYGQIQTGASQGVTFLTSAFGRVKTAISSVVSGIVILVLGFFILSDTPYFHNLVVDNLPVDSQFLKDLGRRVGLYARGQLLVMTAVGVMTWLGLSIIGIPFAFLLGLIAFLLDIIPLVGPVLAFIFGGLVTLGDDPNKFIWTTLLYFVVQQLENYVLVPKILGESVGLHPVWIFLSILLGGALLGISGVLLAVPTAVLINLLYHRSKPQKNTVV